MQFRRMAEWAENGRNVKDAEDTMSVMFLRPKDVNTSRENKFHLFRHSHSPHFLENDAET